MKLFIAAAALVVSFTTALTTGLAVEPSSSGIHAIDYERNKEYCSEVETFSTESFIVSQYRNAADKSYHWCIAVTDFDKDKISWYAKLDVDYPMELTPINLTANVALQHDIIVLDVIASIKTMIEYEYIAGSDVVANVAYNLEMNTKFLTTTGTKYYIRVWLYTLGGNKPYGQGNTKPVKQLVVSNITYDLYIGYHKGIKYITYKATKPVTYFNDDLLVFINHLKDNAIIRIDDHLVKLDAGTRIIQGSSATFAVKQFRTAIKIAPAIE